MPRTEVLARFVPIAATELEAGIRALGVQPGSVVMVHARMSAFGWIVGGSETVLRALLAVIGDAGTICAQVSWDELPFGLADWPPAWQAAYERELPGFDPRVSQAGRFEGRVAERLRSWPGAERSANPDTGIAAVGARARWLVDPHPLDDGFGPGTPYARLVEAGGDVLLLGAPLETISLLHHAEAVARVAGKRRVRYRAPLRVGDGVRWRDCEDIDVRGGPFDYARVVPGGEPPLRHVAKAALRAGVGTRAAIGGAACHRFAAADLTAFAAGWLEERFG